jgi:hypothetical protein
MELNGRMEWNGIEGGIEWNGMEWNMEYGMEYGMELSDRKEWKVEGGRWKVKC